jgi:hypothetical protein
MGCEIFIMEAQHLAFNLPAVLLAVGTCPNHDAFNVGWVGFRRIRRRAANGQLPPEPNEANSLSNSRNISIPPLLVTGHAGI